MLGFINPDRVLTQTKRYRIHIACDDKARCESDVLHRFIAHLKLPNFQIKKVDILEKPIRAKVTFAEIEADMIDSPAIISLFKRKRIKAEKQFKLSLSLYQLDRLGLNFFINYNFENRLGQVENSEPDSSDDDIHAMMKTAFDGSPSFLISRMSDIET